ncbi:hypothetical protein HQ520_17155, partial [bacterium]|nr:hypothetical protein [bacterium]
LYRSPDGLEGTARWSLEPDRWDAGFEFEWKTREAGYVSVGFSAFSPTEREAVEFVQLPPMYQHQRLPSENRLITSSLTPHPLALVQRNALSLAVLAEPDHMPFEWPQARNPIYGFSLTNSRGEAQPTVFSPVLACEGSEVKAGETRRVAWRVLAFPGRWTDAMEYVSANVMKLKDYRTPLHASLTDAVLNMIDLIREGSPAGWDDDLKGFWNIEYKGTVTQAAPLAVVSAAILTRDEKLFSERALPTICFLLSRKSAHFAGVGADRPTGELAGPSTFFGTTCWQGLHDLLGRLNPWLVEIGMPNGEIRHDQTYNVSPRWSELLAAWRLKPEPALLDEIQKLADRFIDEEVFGTHTEPINYIKFYNISFYPYWWDLVDLYELTGKKRYLEAAEEGAFHTMAGIWSQPPIPDGKVTIHPDGQPPALGRIAWKGTEKFRLNYPIPEGMAKERGVPAWTVAQVGLGFEQPSTYFAEEGHMKNILMSCWAPHLLRMYEHTGRDIYQTYARNAIIGRFTNYPGYYVCGLTDLYTKPDYPCVGPDVTALYFHHVPPQLAFALDYLVAQAEQRSKGAIQFPWSKQQNYAWFINRVYDLRPGQFYGEDGAVLWLDRQITAIQSKDVDWIAARGTERFYLALMSQSDEIVRVNPGLNSALIGLRKNGKARVIQQDGSIEEIDIPNLSDIAIPPRGIVSLSLPAEKREQFPKVPPLKKSEPQKVEIDGPWGNLHAYRIRTPFGRDALYAYFDGNLGEDARAILTIKGMPDAERSDNVHPYEFIVYPVEMDRDLEITVSIQATDRANARKVELSLPAN